ncbi:MAG: hypothetical protein P4L40_08535 [Terracidiphilus sp.]|nr:hypothetical protein [Terracidiphilus sp.]
MRACACTFQVTEVITGLRQREAELADEAADAKDALAAAEEQVWSCLSLQCASRDLLLLDVCECVRTRLACASAARREGGSHPADGQAAEAEQQAE